MKKILDFKLLTNELLNQDTYLLGLECTETMPDIKPGQFVNVKIDNSTETFLRRPISIHDVDIENNILYLYVKVLGNGTRKMKDAKEGDIINILIALGNSFTMDYTKNPLLIGGGCGIAPMLYLAKDIFVKTENKPTILLGARTSTDLLRLDEFEKYADVYYTTEDGSAGEKGYPTTHSIFSKEQFDFIYCCGPDPMMKAVAKLAKDKEIECEVSLENTMACGIGACLCCVQDTKEGHKCVCTDGPVFNIKDLKW
ncbi:MAG: dihydroorotate dehydrogenase electron transfer subunit [Marinifilaceae bacterium]